MRDILALLLIAGGGYWLYSQVASKEQAAQSELLSLTNPSKAFRDACVPAASGNYKICAGFPPGPGGSDRVRIQNQPGIVLSELMKLYK